MGKKSSPPPVDYAAAAQQQGAANKETAIAQSMMNNPNMVTPYGNQTYTMGADGRPVLTQSLSPAEQAKLDASNRIQTGSLGILEEDLPNIRKALSGEFGLKGGATPGNFNGIGKVQTQLGNIGNVQEGLDFSGAPGMPQSDFGAQMRTMLAQYQKGAQFLDPQFAQAENDQRVDLANQGIARGTEAYNREDSNLARKKMGAYSDLIQNSILSGNQELNAQYARDMASRQQGVGETAQKGTFANDAQKQMLTNAMSRYDANNQGVAQNANIQQMIAQLMNSARSQNYSEYSNNRTMPINMLNALLSSSQVNNPQFQATQGTNITPAPIMQGAQLQGQQNAATGSANSAGQGQTMGMVGSLATAAAMFF